MRQLKAKRLKKDESAQRAASYYFMYKEDFALAALRSTCVHSLTLPPEILNDLSPKSSPTARRYLQSQTSIMETLKKTLSVVVVAPFCACFCCIICWPNLYHDLREGLWRNPFYMRGGYCGTNRRNSTAARQAEVERRRLLSNKPRRLPSFRSRRLTLPLNETRQRLPLTHMEKQRAYSQQYSSFFSRLPIEIRRIIYHEVIVGNTPNFRILQKKYQPRLGHLSYAPRPDRIIFDNSWWGHVGAHNNLCQCCTREETDGGLLAPLLTCRQFYSEAIQILYEEPVFEFKDPSTFLAFHTTVLSQRLHKVASLHLTWEIMYGPSLSEPYKDHFGACQRCCRLLSKMSGLRHLTVVIDKCEGRATGEVSSKVVSGYLQLLHLIRHVNEFVVGLAWECDLKEYKDERASFKLVQKASVSKFTG